MREKVICGTNNLEELINEIVKLKMKSKKEHDTMMYNQLNSSLT